METRRRRKTKLVKKVTTLPLVLAVVFSSCLEEAKFFPDPSNDVSKTDTDDMSDAKRDLIQTDCDPACTDGKVCKTDGFTCVDCLGDNECTDQVCDTDSNTCVDCKDNSTCTDVTTSLCTDGNCGACVADADCTHITGMTRCDGGTCKDGCSTDEHCGGKVCDVTTNLCTGATPGLLAQCLECVSDTECLDGYHCVPLDFPVGTPNGNYCLRTFRNVACPEPFKPRISKPSLNGEIAEEHCSVVEELTTCDAVLALGTFCGDGGDMGEGNADPSKCVDKGAICENIGAEQRCTYSCNGDEQCKVGKTCIEIDGGTLIGHCDS